ncbi:MAG: hypothetical protein CMH57_05820 [Myxococcales bacterium]|nr:hypothetical protein [Myxococcales bacterium]
MARQLPNPLLPELEAQDAHLTDLPWPSGKGSVTAALHFGDPAAEQQALLTGAAIADLTGRSLLRVTGRDRLTWLHGLCTQEIKSLEPGQGAYACHVDIKGKIQTDLRVTLLPDSGDLLLDMEPGEARRMRRAFKRYIIMEQVKVADVTDAQATIGLFGPDASAALQQATGADLSALPTHHVREVQLAGVEILAIASELIGQRGYRLVCPREQTREVWSALREQGLAAAGHEALEATRIRLGRPRFGADLTDSVLFNEALLADAVSFTKGCYLGQEIVERVDARGRVGRKLLGLRLMCDREALPPVGSAIANASRALGHLTSVAWQEDLGYGAALGLIHRADNEPGASLLIRPDDGPEVEAIVALRDGIA